MSLYDKVTIRPRKEMMRLLSMKLAVPTEEQIETRNQRAISENRTPRKPTAYIVLEFEPLTYTIEGSKIGNRRLEYVDVSFPLDDEALAAVRSSGWHGIPESRLIRTGVKGKPEDARDKWGRFVKYAAQADLDLDIGDDGQPVSADIGKVVEVLEGNDDFPRSVRKPNGKWVTEGSYQVFCRYIISKAPANWTPPDEVRVIVVNNNDDDELGTAASAVTSGGGIDPTALKEAVWASGMVGKSATDFATATAQNKFIGNAVSTAPILLTNEPSAAASEGKLLDYLVTHGAIVIEDGVIKGVA